MTIESAMMYSTLTNISQRFYLKSIGRLQQLVIIGINPQLTRVDEIEQLFEDKRIHVVNHHSVFIFQQPIISNSGIIFLRIYSEEEEELNSPLKNGATGR